MKRKTKFKLAAGVLCSVIFLSGCKKDYLELFKGAKADLNNDISYTTTPDEIELTEEDFGKPEEDQIIEITILESEESEQPTESLETEASAEEKTEETVNVDKETELPEEPNIVEQEQNQEIITEEILKPTVCYDIGYLNEYTDLRAGNNEIYPIINCLEINSKIIRIFSCENGWDFIKSNKYVGYVPTEYISYSTKKYVPPEEYVITKYNDIVFTTSILNYRSAPNIESDIIDTFNVDTELQVIAKVDNGWYAVVYNGNVGFVHGGYVVSILEIINNLYPELQLEELTIKDIVYPTTQLNYRCGNSTDFESLGLLEKYETLRVLGEYDDWYFIMTNERNLGFVNKNYTKKIDDKCIIIDKSCQQLYFYREGNLLYTTDVTTGKDSTPSDTGLFKIWRKETDTYLTDGKTYYSHVDYCMYYNGGEAVHDADWRYMFYVENQPERKKFGTELYHQYGSHGCINTPLEVVEKLYYEVEKGDKVLVHK